ncbi:MAG: acyl-CoA dehydrogenase family protein [Tissierellia bacterium]|nr:acyl-CoA dehydrogenase family protein [Tissierellia bacterium]
MNYKVPEEHEALRKRVREFAEGELAGSAFTWDQEGSAPADILAKLGEAELLGVSVPKAMGGQELDLLAEVIVVEELARVEGGVATMAAFHNGYATRALCHASDSLKGELLPKLTKGEALATFAGEDALDQEGEAVATTFKEDGDGYVLNGKKLFVANAPVADYYVVLAKNGGEETAFVVAKNDPGVSFGEELNTMGIRSAHVADLILDNVKVPKDRILSGANKDGKMVAATLAEAPVVVGALALGMGQGSYEKALEYSKERIQFGKPIAALQGISFQLADMDTALEGARLTLYKAASCKEKDARAEAARAKIFASDIAHTVVNQGLQIFGGSGFIKGMEVERFYRDQKITQIIGTSNEKLRDFLADELFA